MPTIIPKILLVEDDNNLREIFEMRLKAEGYDTVTAGNGEEALVVAMKEKPDLIIADVMMPKLSGFEMLETLRATPEMAATKTIMMTALGQAEDRARGERLGVIKYLVKSQVTLEDFVRVVREVLEPSSDASASTSPGPTSVANSNQVQTNQESEAKVPDDTSTTPSTPDTPTGDGVSNPVSGTPADSATSSQPTTNQEQSEVQSQIDSFAGAGSTSTDDTAASTAPAIPSDNMAMSSGTPLPSNLPASDTSSSAPAEPAQDAAAPEAPADAPAAQPAPETPPATTEGDTTPPAI
ncbi:MAG TPA: response regulator [Candidatus Binatia bacterium]|nr:response regulator [Candidatus Binatia bacterium]